MSDAFQLSRFVDAQEQVFPRVLSELVAGHKTSHWMWFIFPQLDGLGHSAMAERYAISGLAEARAYLNHPLLGARLLQCIDALLPHTDKTARQILGRPDDLKLRSCLTLFAQVDPHDSVIDQALLQFYAGEADPATLDLLVR
ncbi:MULTISPECIES: DUF1810 domain-containing protein [Pseudomonas]|uniref:DUF1810 domain-containing protein n=1 Tax=Pseudomonas TaxID=286 RepID=UPI0028DE2411|nr:DUF1810 domain-containing protein [Pseudomonas taiwanensis]MDT8921639.1 DUF1810 domain-containing protein [Pseudomonas taiwanensis]